MAICSYCNQPLPEERIIFVASDFELRNRGYIFGLGRGLNQLPMAREYVPDWALEVIYDCPDRIFWPHDHSEFDLSADLAELFPASQRWISELRRAAANGHGMAFQTASLPKVRIVDLAFRIRLPKIAAEFSLHAANDNDPT